VQVGTFTLKSNQAEMLGEEFTSFHNDIQDAFQSHSKKRMQCAKVAETEERRWVRVMGIRHDLQLWCSDKRVPKNPFSRPNLVGAPAWLSNGLSKLPKGLGTLMLEEWGGGDAPFLRAATIHDNTLKEVMVMRDPCVVHVFNVVEHGRRFFRTQVYSSDASFSLHQMPVELVRDESSLAKRRDYRLASGDALDGVWPSPTLVVSRNVCSGMGRQRYIPRRMLHGVLPDCLLEDYTFWQSEAEDGSAGAQDIVRGYKTEAALARDSGVPLTMIVIELIRQGSSDKSGRCQAAATAKVRRI
jgi:hypothetical protein